MPNELNANAQKWVDALRSGDYKQGRKTLHNTNEDTFCPLGVACDIFAKENPTRGRWSGGDFLTSCQSNRSGLPLQVADWLGMKRKPGTIALARSEEVAYLANAYATYGPASGQNLVQDNDTRRLTFAQIADIIEAHQKELFNA